MVVVAGLREPARASTNGRPDTYVQGAQVVEDQEHKNSHKLALHATIRKGRKAHGEVRKKKVKAQERLSTGI